MTTKLNEATSKMLDSIDLVRVSFQDLSTGGKLYTYKASKGLFEANSLAVAQAKDKFKFVLVDSIVPDNQKLSYLNVSYDLVWLLCRVTDGAKELKEKEAKLMDS